MYGLFENSRRIKYIDVDLRNSLYIDFANTIVRRHFTTANQQKKII